VALDATGNLYIADGGNGRIRKVSGGTITTVAGNGRGVFSGDGGPATSASLHSPTGVALDSAGNLYIADRGNNRIRKVTGGTITTVAGNGTMGFSGDGGPATSASLVPVAVTVDSAGNIYVADSFGNRIRKISGGTITTVAGNGTMGFSGDGGPATSASLGNPFYGTLGVSVDAAGNLYIADNGNNRIREVLSGKPLYQAAPSTMSFSAVSGGNVTGGQVISLSSLVPGIALSASASASWLTVTPSIGSIPTTLQVTADPSTLAAGSYQGAITITVPSAAAPTTTIPVTFTVQSATPAALGVDTQSVSFTAS
jgi:sugar lactone lactonase YvrE